MEDNNLPYFKVISPSAAKHLPNFFQGKVNDVSVNSDGSIAVLCGEKGFCILSLDRLIEEQPRLVHHKTKLHTSAPTVSSQPSSSNNNNNNNNNIGGDLTLVECSPVSHKPSLLAATNGLSVLLWDFELTSPFSFIHQAHSRVLTDMSWSKSNPDLMATSSTDDTIKIWDIRDISHAVKIRTLQTYSNSLSHLEWAFHNPLLLASSHGTYLNIWDLRNPSSALFSHAAHLQPIVKLDWSRTGNSLASFSQDNHVKCWDVSTVRCKHNLNVGSSIIWGAFSPFSEGIVVASQRSFENSMRFWGPSQTQAGVSFSGLGTGLISCDWSVVNNNGKNNYRVVGIRRDQFLQLWDIGEDVPSLLNKNASVLPSPRRISPSKTDPNIEDQNFDLPSSLEEEFALLKNSPLISDQLIVVHYANPVTRVCAIGIGKSNLYLRVFCPAMYPLNAPPTFEFVDLNDENSFLTTSLRTELKELIHEIASKKVAQSRTCIEVCVETVVNFIKERVDPDLLKLVFSPPTTTITTPTQNQNFITRLFGSTTTPSSSSTIEPLSSRERSQSLKNTSEISSLKSPQLVFPPSIDENQISQLFSENSQSSTQTMSRVKSLSLSTNAQISPSKSEGGSEDSISTVYPNPIPSHHKQKWPQSGIIIDSKDKVDSQVLVPYTVKATDTLAGIALFANMTLSDLKFINRLHNTQVIPGQILQILAPRSSDTDSKDEVQNSSQSGETTTLSVTVSEKNPEISSQKEKRKSILPLIPTTNLSESIKKDSQSSSTIISSTVIKSHTSCTVYNSTYSQKRKEQCPVPIKGELTLTPRQLIFEPNIDDPHVIKEGLFKCHLSADLQQICACKAFLTEEDSRHDFKRKKRKEDKEKNKSNGNSSTGLKKSSSGEISRTITDKMIMNGDDEYEEEWDGYKSVSFSTFPCLEISVLRGRLLERVTFQDIEKETLVSLYQSLKQWVLDCSKKEGTSGLLSQSMTLAESVEISSGVFNTSTTKVLNSSFVKAIRHALPARYKRSDWELIYSTMLDGISLNTFYNRLEYIFGPTILVVEDTNRYIFGAFCSDSWKRKSTAFYGDGTSFLFSLAPGEPKTYLWTGDKNFFMNSGPDYIAVGGGSDGFGIWLDADFDYGASSSTETFGNPCLASGKDFRCVVLEVWGFR